MNIGTAVPTPEELSQVPHHFIQHLSINDPYSVGDFKRDALKLLPELYEKSKVVIMVGGSGMYADALLQGLDEFPATDPNIRTQLSTVFQQQGIEVLQDLLKQHDFVHYQNVDRRNPHRLIRALEVCLSSGKPYSSFLGQKKAPNFFHSKTLVIQWDRPTLYDRINQRVDQMVAMGLEEEARQLYPQRTLNALQTVGYNEWFTHFDGESDRETAINEIKKNSRRYAKRQATWFRRSKDALGIEGGLPLEEMIKTVDAWM